MWRRVVQRAGAASKALQRHYPYQYAPQAWRRPPPSTSSPVADEAASSGSSASTSRSRMREYRALLDEWWATRQRLRAEAKAKAAAASAARGGARARARMGAGAGFAASADALRARAAAAGYAVVGSCMESLRNRLGWTTVTPDMCADACTDLLNQLVTTKFTTYRQERLYTIELEAPYPGAPVLVLCHGYGSGSGLWCFNLDALAKHFKVYAVDWLGCGASERPEFTAKTVKEGETFFTESLEAWRKAQKIDKMVLVGHSLGGYLSAAYTLHHPTPVQHLVLVSPAGIPTPPDPQILAQRRSTWLMGLLGWAWERNVTPQSLVRALGPWGEKWAGGIIAGRFRRMLAAQEKQLDPAVFVKYLYQITAAEGSGEYALGVLLQFGAHAKEPMGPRLLAAATIGERSEEPEIAPHRYRTPVTFFYGGSHDWMSADAGYATVKGLQSQSVDAAIFLTPESGHHLYAEQPRIFEQQLLGRLLADRSLRRR